MKFRRIKYVTLIFLLCFPITVSAVNHNTIRIHLKNLETPLEGVPFEIYQVGSIKESIPVIDSRFPVNTLPKEAYLLDNTAKEISGMLSGTADRHGYTDKNGSLVFDGMANGVYLIRMSESHNYGIISPFLVWLPYYDEDAELHTIEIEPKASKPYPTVTDNTDAGQQQMTSSPSPTKTGDKTDYLKYIVLSLLSLAVCLVLPKKKGGRL